MLTHSDFQVLRFLPATVVFMVLTFSLVCRLIILCREEKNKNCNSFERLTYTLVSWFTGDWIQSKDDKYYLKIEGEKVEDGPLIRREVLYMLFFYVVILMLFADVTFFELFLFATSFTCNNDTLTFCFPTGDNSSEIIQNCALVDGNVICYWLQFNFVTAAGVLGGLLTVIKFITMSLNYVLIKYSHRDEKHECWVLLYNIFLFVLVIILSISCTVGAISQRRNGSTFSDMIVFIFQYFSVIITIILGGLVQLFVRSEKANKDGSNV